uniref:Uncharacterized protein n=1 Tax=Oryza punctata TaxID=4537 RepID=A0A0E0LAM5_ORYPU
MHLRVCRLPTTGVACTPLSLRRVKWGWERGTIGSSLLPPPACGDPRWACAAGLSTLRCRYVRLVASSPSLQRQWRAPAVDGVTHLSPPSPPLPSGEESNEQTYTARRRGVKLVCERKQ